MSSTGAFTLVHGDELSTGRTRVGEIHPLKRPSTARDAVILSVSRHVELRFVSISPMAKSAPRSNPRAHLQTKPVEACLRAVECHSTRSVKSSRAGLRAFAAWWSVIRAPALSTVHSRVALSEV